MRAGIYYSKWGKVPTSDNEPGDFLIFVFVFVYICFCICMYEMNEFVLIYKVGTGSDF